MIHHHPLFLDAVKKASSLLDQNSSASASQLRELYQSNKSHQSLHSAYVLSRMPATYAAILSVLCLIQNSSSISSVVDLGTGPGTAVWPLFETLSNLKHFTGYDVDPRFIRLNKDVFGGSLDSITLDWRVSDYASSSTPLEKADLVLMSYSLGEHPLNKVEDIVKKIWESTVEQYFVLIEPGTPKGFEVIRKARDYLILNKGFVVAPCMGNYACPMLGNDWCHFSVQLQRTALQKHFKKASLPYEDEKYSYLIVSKGSLPIKSKGRVIKKPRLRGGHVMLDVCSEEGYTKPVIGKSDDTYRRARKLDWGDEWEAIE
jgi:ribosomal protein RSM22 (predicted rRNA methylase)